MRSFKTTIVCALVSLLTWEAAIAQPMNACKAEVDALSNSINSVTDKYRPQLDALAQTANTRAKKIKDDNPPPSQGGAAIGFDIKVTSHDQVMYVGLPTATMKTTALSWDQPQVTTRRQSWSWSVPETTSERQCTQGPPELVCSAPTCNWRGCSGGGCNLRAGPEICTNVPIVRMVTREASMDVPDVVLRRVDIKLDLPEVSIKEQRLVVTIPDFTLVNVSYQKEELKNDSEQLQKDMDVQSQEISILMKNEIKEVSGKGIIRVFSCYQNDLVQQRDNTLASLDAKVIELRRLENEARTQKNEQVASELDKGISKIVESRAQFVLQFQKALDDLAKSQTAALHENTRP